MLSAYFASSKKTSVVSALRTMGADASEFTAQVISGPEWTRTIVDFDELSQEQLYEFAVALHPRAKVEAVLFMQGGEPVGATLVRLRAIPGGLGTLAIIKWGPMLRRADAAGSAAAYASMIDLIATEYGDRRGMMVSIQARPPLSEPDTRHAMLAERGFEDGSVWQYPSTYIMDLHQDDDTMRKNLRANWRGHLNKAERLGLKFEIGVPEQLGAFDALHREMTARKKFDDLTPYHTLPAVMAIQDPALRPVLFFVRDEENIVAGAVVFRAGTRARYLYGATGAAALSVNAGHFMQWNIARWLRDNSRAQWYELGGADGVEGLTAFKSGLMGGSGVEARVPPSVNYASAPLARLLGRGTLKARDQLVALRRRLVGLRRTGR